MHKIVSYYKILDCDSLCWSTPHCVRRRLEKNIFLTYNYIHLGCLILEYIPITFRLNPVYV
jgi:hypothetical protein